MKITINRYIAIKKIHYAAELIRTGVSANEAALAAGYNHYTTFYHNYKQIMGYAPMKNERDSK
jgi:methylphosphotriester-DNA--protein-cysteine methyltransferase